MPSLPGTIALARRILLSTLSGSESSARPCHSVAVLQLSMSNLGDGRHDFPGHPEAAGPVVSRNVVRNQPEERLGGHLKTGHT